MANGSFNLPSGNMAYPHITSCHVSKTFKKRALMVSDFYQKSQQQVEPDSISFNSAVGACQASGETMVALSLLAQMKSKRTGIIFQMATCVFSPRNNNIGSVVE